MKIPKVKPPYSRVRNKNTVLVVGGHIKGVQVSSGVTTVLQDDPRNAVISNQDTMSDVVQPGYQQLISAGQVVSHPMSQVKTLYSCSDSGCELTTTSGSTTATWTDSANIMYFYFGMPTTSTLDIDVENLVRYSNTKALAGARSSNFQGMVTLAEAGKTLRMLMNPLGSVHSLVSYIYDQRRQKRNLKIDSLVNGAVRINGRVFHKTTDRGLHRGPGRVIQPRYPSIVVPFGDAVSGTVLMNNLGLRPLMMDIDFITNQIKDLHTKSERMTSRGSEKDSRETVSTSTTNYGAGRFTIETTRKTEVSVRSFVSWFDQFDVLQDHGMAVYDIPSTLYELVPFSFVLDYFLNLGKMLEAYRALATQKFYNGGHTIRIDNSVSRKFVGAVGIAPWTMTRAPAGGDNLSVIVKTRSIQFPEVGLAFKPLSGAFRPTVVQNLIGLTVQKLIHLGKPGVTSKTPFY